MWRDRLVVAAVLTLAASAAVAPQTEPTGSIAGAVVDPAGQPLAGAALTVADAQGQSHGGVSGAAGEFQFVALPAGRYALAATADGFLQAEYGAFQAGDRGVPIRVEAGKRTSNLILVLHRGGAISGRILSDQGGPVASRVSVLAGGADSLRTAKTAGTSADGSYRVDDLAPGSFFVLAVPESYPIELPSKDASAADHPLVQTPTFYPSSTSLAGAALVTVGADDEARDVNVQVQTQPAASVELHVTTASGQPADRVRAALVADDDRGPAGVLWAHEADADGNATIPGVIAGQYRIVAAGQERTPAGTPPLLTNEQLQLFVQQLRGFASQWSIQHVAVDGLAGLKVAVSLQPGATLECRPTFDGAAKTAVRLRPLTADVPATLDPAPLYFSGSAPFTFSGLPPGRFLITSDAGPAGGPSLKAADLGGADVLDLPVELRTGDTLVATLVFTDRQSLVSGAVAGPDGRPRFDVAVVIFPRDPRYWLRGTRRIVVTRPDTSGEYEAAGLPAGDYFAAAFASRPPDDVSDASWLGALQPGAVPVSVAAGQHVVQDLRAGR